MKLLIVIISLLFTIALTSCAAKQSKPEVIDEESGYTQRELDECAVIVESNQTSCDPDGDIASGDIDAAI